MLLYNPILDDELPSTISTGLPSHSVMAVEVTR